MFLHLSFPEKFWRLNGLFISSPILGRAAVSWIMIWISHLSLSRKVMSALFLFFSFDFSLFLRFLEFFLFFSFPGRPKLGKNQFDDNEERDYLDRNILRRISQQHGDARHEHSLIEYTLKIKRRPLYYTMLMIMPCVVCTLLVLASFAIPPEISERIGFCSTVMLSISVYLLIMADILPEKSDTLPILGIYYIITMLEITLPIIGTIIVFRIYHSVSEPPNRFKTL